MKSLHFLVFTIEKSKFESNENQSFENQPSYDFIRQFVENNVYNLISNEKNAKFLWMKIGICMFLNQRII